MWCSKSISVLSVLEGTTTRRDPAKIFVLSPVTLTFSAALQRNMISERSSLFGTDEYWAPSVTNDDFLRAKHYLPISDAVCL